MKKNISYEKDIIFKTNIGEICSISLEHDFTVDDNVLKGEFIVSGEYKPNELSLNKEPFDYHLPLEYELESNVDLSTLSYDIENFEYNVKDDELSVYIDFGVRYEEKKNEPNIPEITEDDLNADDYDIELPTLKSEPTEDRVELMNNIVEKTAEVEPEPTKKEPELDRLDEEDKEMILETALDKDEYITYHVHIVREGETLETIASKYGVTIDLIKEYNNIESLEIKSKLIIPDAQNE